MAQPPISAISLRHWLVVTGAGLLMALNVLVFLAAGMLLPPLADSLGVGLSQVMVFVSINMVAGAATLTLAGPQLLRRLGSRRLALIGGLVTGTMLFAVAGVTELWQLYLLAFGSGVLATVALQMTGAALVSDWFEQRRGLMQGVLMGIASLGGIAAGAGLPAVLGAGGWRLGFQVVGGVSVIVAVFAGLVLIRNSPAEVGLQPYGTAESIADHAAQRGPVPKQAVRSSQFVALLVGLACFSAIMALQQHFPAIMAERGLDLAAAGALLSMLSAVNVVSTLLLGNLSDRFGPLVAYGLAGVLLLAALTLFVVGGGIGSQAIAVLLFSIPAITPPILTPILLRASFGDRSFVPLLGVATATMPAGIAFGSPLWGLAKDATGSYDSALLASLGLVVLILGLVGFAVVTGPRRWRF